MINHTPSAAAQGVIRQNINALSHSQGKSVVNLTDEHDVDFKLKHASKFLNEGAKVRAYVFFKGRTIIYKERGEELLMRFANKLIEEGVAKLESTPKQEGKKMIILLGPTKKK